MAVPVNICPNCRHRGPEKICPRDGFPMVDAQRYDDSGKEPDLTAKVFDNKYEVQSLIGRGGMGVVWRARHLVMQNDVALKVMRHNVGGGLKAVQRFYNEARASSQLSHPNTIRVTDFGATDDGFLYMAMELLRGQDLGQVLLSQGSLEPLRAVRVGQQICKSLAEAHARGMIHRDLKPSNIFFTEIHGESDFVKVIDFGIAKAIESEVEQGLTRTGMVMGTPRYMAPEQASLGKLSPRTDLYTFGVVLYEMLTRDIPFSASADSDLLVAHLRAPPRPLPDAVMGVLIPEDLKILVSQLLEKDPDCRPPSGEDVARQLAQIERQLLTEQTVAVDERRAAQVAVTMEAEPQPELQPIPQPTPVELPPTEENPVDSLGLALDTAPTTTTGSVLQARRRWPALVWVTVAAAAVVGLVILLLEFTPPDPSSPVETSLAAVPLAPAKAIPPAVRDAAGEDGPTAIEQNGPPTVVWLVSQPKGATVKEGSQVLGKTPLELKLNKGQQRRIKLHLSGYAAISRVLSEDDNERVTLQLKKKKSNTGVHKTGAGKAARSEAAKSEAKVGDKPIKVDYQL